MRWTGAAEKRENEMGGKIKGSEFIFALIATELRNCLTGKIAPAQANYIHLLSLLAFIGTVLFYLSRSRLSHFPCFSLHLLSSNLTHFLFYLFLTRQQHCSISSYFRGLFFTGVTLSFYYLIWNNRIICLYNNMWNSIWIILYLRWKNYERS